MRVGFFSAILISSALIMQTPVQAGEIQFSAQVDRPQISQDDSVSLKISVQSDGNTSIGQPKFVAPDFEVVNEYTGNSFESVYENGQFRAHNVQEITKVLRPTRQGNLKISDIQITADGKTYHSPDITVTVSGAGAGTPPPRGYGSGSANGLRGAGKHTGASAFVRAEVDKDKAFKGEQIIVSYYLYRRVRMFNISVDKYPVLTGFLREDLEMPILGQRLDSERVIVDGAPYDRSLLLRYAAYPLQEGQLKIDSLALKYAYYANPGNSPDDQDPFQSFFQQMTPRTSETRSEQITVDVVPVPEAGKPASFTGGVGDFNLTSAVDKYDTHANEAVNLTVKIEGHGNLAAIGEPKAKWPDNVELYDSKGHVNAGKGGVGEKVFEFLLIPRVPGKVELPALEFSYFDPSKKEYVTKKTEPISINVSEPAAGSAAYTPLKSATQGVSPNGTSGAASKPGETIHDLKPMEVSSSSSVSHIPVWRWLYWASLIALGVFALLILYDFARKMRGLREARVEAQERAHRKSWERLRADVKAATNGASWAQVTQAYETLSGVLFDAIDARTAVGARSQPRSELRRVLVDENGLAQSEWERLNRVLAFAEMVRFASSAGAISENQARTELGKWVLEAQSLCQVLLRSGNKTDALNSEGPQL